MYPTYYWQYKPKIYLIRPYVYSWPILYRTREFKILQEEIQMIEAATLRREIVYVWVETCFLKEIEATER